MRIYFKEIVKDKKSSVSVPCGKRASQLIFYYNTNLIFCPLSTPVPYMKAVPQKESEWILKEKYRGEKSPSYFRDLKRLARGEPIDYIIGHTSFLSSHIDLSKGTFIPRTETEFWVEKAINEIKSNNQVSTIKCLDMFSGSGCIGVSLAKHLPRAHVIFAEKNEKFVKQIAKNIALNNIGRVRTNVIQTDSFSSLQEPFHYIFANPPYIAKNRFHDVEKSVRDYEPHEALFAKDSGLFHIKETLSKGHAYLYPGGTMFIEFDSWQQPHIEKYLADLPYHYRDVTFWSDIYNRPRVVTATKLPI